MGKRREIPKFKLHGSDDTKLFVVDDLLAGRNRVDGDVATVHVHSFHEIFWHKRALNGKRCVDLDEYRIERNTVIFVPVGSPHGYIGEMEEADNGIVIRFSDHFLSDAAGGIGIHELFCGLDSCRCYYVTDELAAKLEHLESAMRLESSDCDSLGHDEYLRSLLNIFLIYVHREGRGTANSASSRDINSIRRFWQMKTLLDQNYSNVHTVQGYADMMGVSSRSLNECVRTNAGCSPLELINKRIMLEAKRMLVHTNMSIKEVSRTLGFEDASYFVKFFRRCDGRTPSELRSNP